MNYKYLSEAVDKRNSRSMNRPSAEVRRRESTRIMQQVQFYTDRAYWFGEDITYSPIDSLQDAIDRVLGFIDYNQRRIPLLLPQGKGTNLSEARLDLCEDQYTLKMLLQAKRFIVES